MGTGKISLSSDAQLKTFLQGNNKKTVSSPIESAKEYSDKIKTETEEHDELSQEEDYYRTINRRINSGFYNKSQLENIFANIKAPTRSTNSNANGIMFYSMENLVNNIKTQAEAQAKKLEDFDSDVRYEDIITSKTDKEGVATKEDWDFAQAVLKELRDSGNNYISFNEVLSVLSEIQSGDYIQ